MADGPALALQAALVAALKADRIGTVDLRPLRLSGECSDEDFAFSIEAHSRPVAGRVEAARLAHAVRTALDGATLTVTGYTFEWCDWTTQAVTRAADGESYIATIAFEAALGAA